MFKSSVPVLLLPIACAVGCLLTVLILTYTRRSGTTEVRTPVPMLVQPDCAMHFTRISGYRNIRPLLTTEQVCASPRYDGIKAGVERILDDYRRAGTITDAAMYMRDFRKAEWTACNGDALFEPGSLMKIPLMMTYLRMAEKDPSVMHRPMVLAAGALPPKQVFFPPSESIVPGRPYTVTELLDQAIGRSDNLAVAVLLRNVEMARMHRTYIDLGLADFKNDDSSYPISAKDFSVFMKALYSATYLSIDDSELAISLLLESEFDQGIKAGLPSGVQVAHKFGEALDATGMQLHETALIYEGYDAYLLTVMTKGPDIHALPQVIAAVSRFVYEEMVRLRGGTGV